MPSRSARFVATGVLALHLVGGVAALVLLPRGFAFGDLHFWSNTAIPAIASLAAALALIGLMVARAVATTVVSVLIAATAGGWICVVIAGSVAFPTSMPVERIAIPALIAVALLALAWWSKQRVALSTVGFVVGAGLGFVVILAQRAAPPSTRPLGATLADVRGEFGTEAPADGELVISCGKHPLRLNPLLTFHSRSPDRTWTVLFSGGLGARRMRSRYEKTADGFRAAYSDDGESTLVVREDANGVDIEAVSKLPTPVYSHLNSFTSIRPSFEATLSFKPTGAPFAIEPADYPSGRPVQLAYFDEDLAFRVVRARDAEKGPFTELAAGYLGRGAPLILELRPRDGSDAGCRFIFQDWSSQVSTEPSPTAGWGVPQGSIQFFSRSGQALVLLTLADTGPGRGFDSVGHAAGSYRNRLRVEQIR